MLMLNFSCIILQLALHLITIAIMLLRVTLKRADLSSDKLVGKMGATLVCGDKRVTSNSCQIRKTAVSFLGTKIEMWINQSQATSKAVLIIENVKLTSKRVGSVEFDLFGLTEEAQKFTLISNEEGLQITLTFQASMQLASQPQLHKDQHHQSSEPQLRKKQYEVIESAKSFIPSTPEQTVSRIFEHLAEPISDQLGLSPNQNFTVFSQRLKLTERQSQQQLPFDILQHQAVLDKYHQKESASAGYSFIQRQEKSPNQQSSFRSTIIYNFQSQNKITPKPQGSSFQQQRNVGLVQQSQEDSFTKLADKLLGYQYNSANELQKFQFQFQYSPNSVNQSQQYGKAVRPQSKKFEINAYPESVFQDRGQSKVSIEQDNSNFDYGNKDIQSYQPQYFGPFIYRPLIESGIEYNYSHKQIYDGLRRNQPAASYDIYSVKQSNLYSDSKGYKQQTRQQKYDYTREDQQSMRNQWMDKKQYLLGQTEQRLQLPVKLKDSGRYYKKFKQPDYGTSLKTELVGEQRYASQSLRRWGEEEGLKVQPMTAASIKLEQIRLLRQQPDYEFSRVLVQGVSQVAAPELQLSPKETHQLKLTNNTKQGNSAGFKKQGQQVQSPIKQNRKQRDQQKQTIPSFKVPLQDSKQQHANNNQKGWNNKQKQEQKPLIYSHNLQQSKYSCQAQNTLKVYEEGSSIEKVSQKKPPPQSHYRQQNQQFLRTKNNLIINNQDDEGKERGKKSQFQAKQDIQQSQQAKKIIKVNNQEKGSKKEWHEITPQLQCQKIQQNQQICQAKKTLSQAQAEQTLIQIEDRLTRQVSKITIYYDADEKDQGTVSNGEANQKSAERVSRETRQQCAKEQSKLSLVEQHLLNREEVSWPAVLLAFFTSAIISFAFE